MITATEFNVVGPSGFILPAQYFTANSSPLPTNNQERLIFETDTHMLWADLDGRGDQYATELIAILPSNVTLDASDFLIA